MNRPFICAAFLLAALAVVEPVVSTPQTQDAAASPVPQPAATIQAQADSLADALAALTCGDDAQCKAFIGDAREATPSRSAQARSVYFAGHEPFTFTAWQAERERRCAAIASYAEARNQGPLGMYAVMWTVFNRVEADGGKKTPCQIVVARGVLEAMHRPAFAGETRIIAHGGMPAQLRLKNAIDKQAYREARLIAYLAMSGALTQDPTHGATFYWSPSAQAGLHRRPPSWLKNSVMTAEIALHQFYKPAQPGAVLVADVDWELP